MLLFWCCMRLRRWCFPGAGECWYVDNYMLAHMRFHTMLALTTVACDMLLHCTAGALFCAGGVSLVLASISALTSTCLQTCAQRQQQQGTRNGATGAHMMQGTTTAGLGRRGSSRARVDAGRAIMGTSFRAGTGTCLASAVGGGRETAGWTRAAVACLHQQAQPRMATCSSCNSFDIMSGCAPSVLSQTLLHGVLRCAVCCSGLLVRHARRVLGSRNCRVVILPCMLIVCCALRCALLSSAVACWCVTRAACWVLPLMCSTSLAGHAS